MSSAAPPALQPFLALSKSALGRAAADLVVQATQAPGCYVFSELLQAPNIQALSNSPESSPYFNMLKLFAYGSHADYKANASSLPPLSEKQLEKLKQLSLITIASRGSQYLTYPSLLAELELPSVRALEDLVISAIYAGLLEAKLDTKEQLVSVKSTMGRDVAPDEIASMVVTLEAWSRQCESVLTDIDEQMQRVHREALTKKKEALEYEKLIAQKKEQIAKAEEGKQGKGKRVISEGAEDGRYDDDEMDLDDGPSEQSWGGANTSRRRTKGRFVGLMNKRR